MSDTAHDPKQESLVLAKDEHARLTAETKLLQRALADIKKHHAAGVAGLRKREQKLRAAAKALTRTQSTYEALLNDHAALTSSHLATQTEVQQLVTQRADLSARIQTLHNEAATAEARAKEALTHLAGQQKQIQTEQDKLHTLDAQRRELEHRVAALAGTEVALLHARRELEQTESGHAALTAAMVSLGEQRLAHEAGISALDVRLQRLRADEHSANSKLKHAEEAHHSFQTEAAAEKQRLQEEHSVIGEQLADQQQALKIIAAELAQMQAEHDELQRQNLLLRGAEEKLAGVDKRIAQAEAHAAKIEASSGKLQQSVEALQNKLTQLQSDEESGLQRTETMRGEEAALRETLFNLQAAEKTEQQRFAAAKKHYAKEEFVAAERLAGLEATKDRHERDIVQLEARLHALQAQENDLDRRYAKLASLQEGSPEAMEQWRGIQELKKTIAESLPKKEIQVRPETHMKVVPRGK